MRKFIIAVIYIIATIPCMAQGTLTLDECRRLALENNRQLKVSKMAVDIAENTHKVAKTKYLPHLDGMAGYEHFTKEVSLLNNNQKSMLSNLGTNATSQITSSLTTDLTNMVQQGLISSDLAQRLSEVLSSVGGSMGQAGNNVGQSIRDAFRTNNKNMYAGSILLTQPLYMGGAIKAANDAAAISEDLARNNVEAKRQNVLFAVDNAYWLAVSLKNKERLAKQYLALIQKLETDVQKMIREGVATRSDGLKVNVAVNTADLQVAKVEDAVALTKMALCELCGLTLDGDLQLADEGEGQLIPDYVTMPATETDTAYEARPVVRMMENMVSLTEQNTKLVKALYLPHVVLTGGYTVSNPNVFNGFEKKFAGVWNIGVVAQVPIWNWGESKYRVRSARTMTAIANMELQDLRSKIDLEVEQCKFRLKEAHRKLNTARKNMSNAEENLRCANVGFKEGVMTVTDVMSAQTAWLSSQTQMLDAEIDVRLGNVALNKALGRINN